MGSEFRKENRPSQPKVAASLQRQRIHAGERVPATVPPIVHEVLRSPGEPLDAETRAYFEPRFGHDFSRVRVHADERAAESARAVNALAYTVGRAVVFGVPGGARPASRLLAHELAHVVQQSGVSSTATPTAIDPSPSAERAAESAAATGLSGGISSMRNAIGSITLQRTPAGSTGAVSSLPLEEAVRRLPGMPEADALEVLKRFHTFIRIRIDSGEGRIRQLMALRAESFGNYLIGGTVELFGLTSLPPDNWERAWKPLTDVYGTIAKRQIKESLGRLLEATKITNDYWTQLNEYLDNTEKGADRSIFALQALQAAGAVAATALTGGGAAAVAVGAGYAAAQNLAGQATAVSIGIQKEVDWGGMAFDTLFGIVTGALGGKVGNALLKRLVADPRTASFGRRILSEVATDLLSGRISTMFQTAARQAYDQLRGKEKLTVGDFVSRIFDQLLDPKQIFLDAILGRAAKIAHGKPKGPKETIATEPVAEEPKMKASSAPAIAEPAPPARRVAARPEASAAPPPDGKKVAGRPFWRRKAPEVAGVLEEHPDFPHGNVMVESGIPGLDMGKMMSHLETTPQGELLAQKIRGGEIHLVLSSEPLAEGYAGMASGREIHVTWGGSIKETVSTIIHEGTHWMEPDLAKVGTPEGPSALSIEGSARAFEYEQRLQDNLPAYDPAEQAYRDAHDRVLRETGDQRAANIAADRAMLKAMQQDYKRYGVEPPASQPTETATAPGAAPRVAAAPKPSARPLKPAAAPKSASAKAKAVKKKGADATDLFLAQRKAAKDLIRQKVPVPESQIPDLVTGRRTKRWLSREIREGRQGSKPPHPLDKLADKGGKFLTSTEKGVDEQRWLEDPAYLEFGHVESDKRGGTKMILMSAYKNRLLSATIEHPNIGGEVVRIPQALEIGKVAVDIDTALDLMGAGKITLQDIRNARLVQLFQ